jgi:hypothetical protein
MFSRKLVEIESLRISRSQSRYGLKFESDDQVSAFKTDDYKHVHFNIRDHGTVRSRLSGVARIGVLARVGNSRNRDKVAPKPHDAVPR